jgi:Ni/Fe-hydrogenase subunit HybB-like protein
MDETHIKEAHGVILGFGKSASFIMAGYLAIKIIGLSVDNNWHYLFTDYGAWFLIELIGFVALPSFVYAIGVREKNIRLIQWTSLWTVFGIVLNRFNVSLIAFNWQLSSAERYFPGWMEIAISLFIVAIGIVAYRLATHFLPILHEHPEYQAH